MPSIAGFDVTDNSTGYKGMVDLGCEVRREGAVDLRKCQRWLVVSQGVPMSSAREGAGVG